MKEKKTEGRALFWLLLPLARLILRKYSFRTDRVPELDGPFLMLANHTTEQDFLMAACAARKPLRFVCGEHLLRGRFGKLLQRFVKPIALPKGASSVPAVKEILRRLRQGENVLLFPEGSRSFNGETLPVEPSLGKLVKRSGAALVTYRITGGYFVAPRWAYRTRVGPMEGHVVRALRAEELSGMSVEEITALINRDLYENAYETQEKAPRPYRGSGLAEGLENYLILCPRCGAGDAMVTEGSHFRCTACGLEGDYDEYGFLRGKDLRFRTVFDWGNWIRERFDRDMLARNRGDLLFTDREIRLFRIDAAAHRTEDCLQAEPLKLYHDRLEIGDFSFPFSEISQMAMLYFGKSLLFTCRGEYYGMTGPSFHAWKADRLYRLFRAQANAG